MGIEINLDKLKKLNFQAESSLRSEAVSSEDIEIGAEINGVTEGYSDVAEFSRKESEAPLTAEQAAAKAISDKLRKDDDLRPETLKEFLNTNVSDSELRAEADKCIAELDGMKNKPEKYLKEYKKAKDGSLRKEILEVYIKEERAKALEDFGGFFARAAKTENNYTVILNAYKGGNYYDENGKMKNRGKLTPYQEEAVYRYTTEVMPYEMDERYRAALVAMEKDGTLSSYESDSELAKAVMEKAGVKGSDPKFEQYVKNRKDLSKLTERHDKIMKRREELKKVSEEEINKKLKKETIASIKNYMDAHKNEDGTYDLSEISVAIEPRIGKDFYVNRYDDPNKTLWEVEQVRKELRAPRTGADGNEYCIVNKSSFDGEVGDAVQTKDLIDFCEYEFEPKNHVPSILEAAKGLAEGAVGGLLVHIAAPQAAHLYVEQNVVIQELYNSLSLEEFIDMFGNIDFNAIHIDDNANIIIQQIVDKHLLWKNTLPAVGYGALWGMVAHAATEAIFGRAIACEIECFDKSDYDVDESRYTVKKDYEEYLKSIDNSGTEYNKVKFLLDKYPAKEDGTWDHAHFFNDLRKIAGLGSNLNCAEMAGAKMYPDEPKEAPVKPFKPQAIVFSKIVEEKEPEEDYQKRVKQSQDNYRIMNTNDSDWDTILGLYPCLEEVMGGRKNAVRAIAIIQGIEDDEKFDFNDAAKIRHIVDLSFEYQNTKNKARRAEIEAELEQIPGYKWEKAWNHWKHYQVNRNLPKSIAGCEGPEVLTQQMLKAKKKATNLVDKAEAQKHFDDPSVRTTPIERHKTTKSQAFGKYTKEGNQFIKIGGETEEIVRENLKIMSGLPTDSIPTAPTEEVFDGFEEKFRKQQEENKKQ